MIEYPTCNYVRQTHSRGCGPAALAMITGVPYKQVCADFGLDFDKEGIDYRRLDAWLIDKGWSLARLYPNDYRYQPRQPWPPLPFAWLHICNVEVAENSPVHHFVVMLNSGSCLDPLCDERKRLSDYYKVYNVAGVYKL